LSASSNTPHTRDQVENTLIGAPAALSKRFQKGDAITHIDGTEATKQNIIELLIGSDVPGTIVLIAARRPGEAEPFQAALKRACTTDLADKKRMFQLFTSIKDIAAHHRDLETGARAVTAVEAFQLLLLRHLSYCC